MKNGKTMDCFWIHTVNSIFLPLNTTGTIVEALLQCYNYPIPIAKILQRVVTLKRLAQPVSPALKEIHEWYKSGWGNSVTLATRITQQMQALQHQLACTLAQLSGCGTIDQEISFTLRRLILSPQLDLSQTVARKSISNDGLLSWLHVDDVFERDSLSRDWWVIYGRSIKRDLSVLTTFSRSDRGAVKIHIANLVEARGNCPFILQPPKIPFPRPDYLLFLALTLVRPLLHTQLMDQLRYIHSGPSEMRMYVLPMFKAHHWNNDPVNGLELQEDGSVGARNAFSTAFSQYSDCAELQSIEMMYVIRHRTSSSRVADLDTLLLGMPNEQGAHPDTKSYPSLTNSPVLFPPGTKSRKIQETPDPPNLRHLVA
ncbi:uncharacterized protein BDR25DRAFT_355603 [Lindgomyces ingoldianus]|uniref:Uncharacterized protein n=1 Tax=Lindgomyces ingoldianus TaxID=673940 RepID=A0ACB6QU29_9PLEO|nr:uncharacterized protein BDR25DRAFT_355603 [Lindgomyces ingoldianus]KAF2470514.1 hypothetical protein BDR25DRAFT_355603 [Lindgomyces ingoldianus]